MSLAASLDQECTVEILLPLGTVAMGDLISILFRAARQDLHLMLGFLATSASADLLLRMWHIVHVLCMEDVQP